MRVRRLGPYLFGGDVARIPFYAYADESGIRKHGPKTSAHFVLTASIIPATEKAALLNELARLRVNMGLPVGQAIQFKNLPHQSRVHVTQALAELPYLTIANVIVCKRRLQLQIADVDDAYLLTLRYLLERISWYVDDKNGQAYVTFAHIDRFKISKLHEYVTQLQGRNTQIRWRALHLPVRMETMQTNDFLQVADLTASATGQAVEPDRFGNTERRYVEALAPRIYRYPGGKITSYGMKLHPTRVVGDPEYAWISDL